MHVLRHLSAVLLALAAAAAAAQTWPARPVRTINPFAAGGPSDVLGRLINERLSQRLGQPFLTENRVGASGNIGVDAALKSPPDGYTFAWVVDFVVAFNPALYAKMPFDIEKDLQPVATFAATEVALVVHPSVAAKTMADLIGQAKQTQIAFASAGPGSPGHVFGELFKREFNLAQMLHVPYKGNAPASQSIVAGETQAFFGALPGTIANIRAGKLRALAVFSRERLPYLADVPTAREQGFPKFEVQNWFGIVAPAGTPREIVNRLSQEIAAVAREPEFLGRLEKIGFSAHNANPDEMRALIRRDAARWGEFIRGAGIRAE
ncbi:MAG: tripartite tricarboxylate transporter substrate binding protein [Burkholderiales bacterium]|nr:tripartite tricarboxylate transporter substrate binding protein [Burkholderiales bacterium]